MIAAGVGCRTGVTAEAVTALVEEAFGRLFPSIGMPEGVGPWVKPESDTFSLAVPEFRCNEAGIAAAAATLGVPIIWIAREALKGEQGRCLTRSARAEAEVGLSCVAEAAALAAAGPGSRLILPRIAGRGVTCALAEGPGA